MSKILPNAFFSQHDYKSTQISYTIYFFVLFCQITEVSFSELHFFETEQNLFLVDFWPPDYKSTQISYASLQFFFARSQRWIFLLFSLSFIYQSFTFSKNFKILHFFFLFWKLDNWKCSHLLAHWLFKKKFHYRRSAKRGLTKKENTRENAF